MSTEIEKREPTRAPATVEQVFTSESFKAQVAAALPAHIKPETMMRIALTEVRLNPELLKCTPASFMGALLKSAQAGLRPGMFGECWILPRWSSKTHSFEAQFQAGYQGLVHLAYKTGEISEIIAEAVYVGDHFKYTLGSDPKIEHSPALDAEHSWESVVAFYAVIRMSNGGKLIKVMSRKQVEEHRDRFAPRNKAGQIVGPWVSDPIPMGCKTVLLQVLKFAPKETERLAVAMADADALFADRLADATVERGNGAAQRVASKLGIEPEDDPPPTEPASAPAEDIEDAEYDDLPPGDDPGGVGAEDGAEAIERQIAEMASGPKITAQLLTRLGSLGKQLTDAGITEDRWRDQMDLVTGGKRSRKDLTVTEAKAVAAHFSGMLELARAGKMGVA